MQRPQRLIVIRGPRRMQVTPITIRPGPPSPPRETPTPLHSSSSSIFFLLSCLFSASSVSIRSFAAIIRSFGRCTHAKGSSDLCSTYVSDDSQGGGAFSAMNSANPLDLVFRQRRTLYLSTPSLFNPFESQFSLRLIADVTFPTFYFCHHPCGEPIKCSTSSPEPM